jgi:adenylate cyclase
MRRPEPTLTQLFVWTTVTLALGVGIAFFAFLEASMRSIVQRSERVRSAEAVRIGARLSSQLDVAADALERIAASVRFGAISADDPGGVEARLFEEMIANPALSDVTLTHANLLGYDAAGRAQIAPTGRWQVSVFRSSSDANSPILTRSIAQEGSEFIARFRHRAAAAPLLGTPFDGGSEAPDPTTHPTFETTVSRAWVGKAIWSDLSFSELDAGQAAQRRVVVTVQGAVEDPASRFSGVVRVGLLTERIDALPRLETNASQRVVLCDGQGRLVARVTPSDRLVLVGDDLRWAPAAMPPEVAAALSSPVLHGMSEAHPERSMRLVAGRDAYLATFRVLANSQGWLVGIIVPENLYTADLRALQRRFLVAIGLVTLMGLAAGGILLASLRHALGLVVARTARMRAFDFAPTAVATSFREVTQVMEGLERAKTSLRALGKYVSVDLVRELYRANRDPELGGQLVELSLLFSDIEGFTTLAERLTPDALARALGEYLAAMTAGVRSTQGTIDKFIGDSVMAFWNAPVPCEDHALRACRAVVACQRHVAELYASPAWNGLPPLFTRFGLHRATVMVGNFGAPEHLTYTALGDGVNLASRLEGLCKAYHVSALASESIVNQSSRDFAFRLLDRVAVKGKHEAVNVYELLGERSNATSGLQRGAKYEEALSMYFARDFRRARSLLAELVADDAPSRVLDSRCAAMIETPPPLDWDGVYAPTTK